jgi:hypothetical protein
MAVQVQLRRGNTSQHSTFTGAEGELTVNTEKDIIVVHDGVTAGGHEVARVNNPYFNGTVNVANVNFSNSLHPNSNGTHSIGNGTFRWEKLWLSNSGISIGTNAHTITSNSTTFVFTQNVTTNDSFIIVQGATVGPVVNTSGFYGNVTSTGYINVGNSTVNTTVNATSFTGDSATVGGNTASNLNTYADNKAANAYSNAVSYADGRIIDSVTNTSIAYAASANSVKNAYDRAIDANTRANSAQTAATSAYSNAVAYANSLIIDSVTNTSITYAAAANSVKNAYDRAIDANTRAASAQTEASAAYSNATIFAANASNVNTGTLAEVRLPFRMNQNVQTTDNVTFNDVAVTGNLTLSGNTLIVGANNLIVTDAIISLHSPANLAALTSNDGRNIGLAFHYYDTEDKHALLYRDNTTGYLQYHTDGGDPVSNSNPTGNNFGTIQTAIFWAGNSSVYATVNATNYTGTSNNSLYLGSQLPAYYTNATNITTGTLPYAQIPVNVINTTAAFSISGVYTHTANVIISSATLIKTDSEDSYISNTTTTVTQTAIDAFSTTSYRSAKYIIQATNSTNYHYTEVAVIHDGTTAYATEFATMFTGSSLVSFAVDISGGNVRLLATAANATTTTYKIDRKLIKV